MSTTNWKITLTISIADWGAHRQGDALGGVVGRDPEFNEYDFEIPTAISPRARANSDANMLARVNAAAQDPAAVEEQDPDNNGLMTRSLIRTWVTVNRA